MWQPGGRTICTFQSVERKRLSEAKGRATSRRERKRARERERAPFPGARGRRAMRHGVARQGRSRPTRRGSREKKAKRAKERKQG